MAGAEFHLIFPSITGFPLLDSCIFLARFLTTNSELAVRSGKKPRAADIYLILQVERRRSNQGRVEGWSDNDLANAKCRPSFLTRK